MGGLSSFIFLAVKIATYPHAAASIHEPGSTSCGPVPPIRSCITAATFATTITAAAAAAAAVVRSDGASFNKKGSQNESRFGIFNLGVENADVFLSFFVRFCRISGDARGAFAASCRRTNRNLQVVDFRSATVVHACSTTTIKKSMDRLDLKIVSM